MKEKLQCDTGSSGSSIEYYIAQYATQHRLYESSGKELELARNTIEQAIISQVAVSFYSDLFDRVRLQRISTKVKECSIVSIGNLVDLGLMAREQIIDTAAMYEFPLSAIQKPVNTSQVLAEPALLSVLNGPLHSDKTLLVFDSQQEDWWHATSDLNRYKCWEVQNWQGARVDGGVWQPELYRIRELSFDSFSEQDKQLIGKRLNRNTALAEQLSYYDALANDEVIDPDAWWDKQRSAFAELPAFRNDWRTEYFAWVDK